MSEAIKRRLVGGGVLVLFGLLLPMLLVWSLRPDVAPEQTSLRVYEITATGGAAPAGANGARPAPAPQTASEPEPESKIPEPAARPQAADPQPRPPETEAAPAKSGLPVSDGGGNWIIQVGSFTREENALAMVRKLADEYPAYAHPGRVGGTLYYRVRIGPYADDGDAEAVAAALRQAGHNTQVQRREPDSA